MYSNKSRIWILILFTILYLNYADGKQCTSDGKFIKSYNCSSYMVCNNIIEYGLNCPTGFIVNYQEMMCSNSTNYKCEPSYKCTEKGNFTNPTDEKNASYISCVQGFGEMIIAISINCPNNSVYDVIEEECVMIENDIDKHSNNTENVDLNLCTNGKFVNSYNCDGYIVCNGNIQYMVNCPTGHIVDYKRMICSNTTNYNCKPDYRCMEPGNFTSDDDNSYITCIQGIGNFTFAISAKCPDNQIFVSEIDMCVPKNNSFSHKSLNFWSNFLIMLLLLHIFLVTNLSL